jgi:tetratricopeptide (TPR) repeat protein
LARGGLAIAASLVVTLAATTASGQVVIDGRINTAGTAVGGRDYPNQAFYNAFGSVAEGDFVSAAKLFQNAGRGGYRSSQGRWIDSICYYTMLGEMYFQLGNYDQALQNYNQALQLYLANPDWMRLVDFPTTIGPDRTAAQARINWGPSKRSTVLGRFENGYKLFRGRIDNEPVLRQGGVVALPEFVLVNVHEIVRCTALALRRRIDILGPICRHDELTPMLVNAFEGRVGEANHWSQPWVNVQRGLAQAGAERFDEAARNLQAAIVVNGQFDHPLTATALLELGKLAIARGDNRSAIELLVEASLAAAQFEQSLEMEESLRLANTAHLVSGGQGPLPSLDPVVLWANRLRMRYVQSSCLMSAADCLLHLEKPADASKVLNKSQQVLPRRATLNERLKARYKYLAAQVSAQQNRRDESGAALQVALEAQRIASIGLFRSALTDKRFEEGSFTERVAALLYETLLADPTDADWQNDPLESFVLLTTDRNRSFENWFESALARDDAQKAIEIADRMRRREFYSSLPLGGRLLSLRWLLAGPDALLDADAKLKKQDILARSPKFAGLEKQVQSLQQRLAGLPIAADANQRIETTELAKQLHEVSEQQEQLLYRLALKREASPFLFPPIVKTETIQQQLRPDELLLIYVKSGTNLHAFMLSADKYASWKVDSPEQIKQTLVKLYKTLGNQDANAAINADQFQRMDWRPLARQLCDQLIQRQQFGFWNRYERLVVVPDDIVWHVPFELLLVPEQAAGNGAAAADGIDASVPLITKTKIRYVPTASLSIPDTRPEPRLQNTPVVVGELYPRHGEQTREQFAEWQASFTNLQPLPEKLPAASGILRTVWDRLVVLDDLDNRRHDNHSWSPAAMDKPTAADEINQWLKLPWGGPQEILLPGFHTAAEDGLRKPDDGQAIFLASTALMATGAKTILLSRWRTGG